MNERIVVEHATKIQVANLAQSRTLKVTKPQGDQSIVLDLSDRNTTFDLSAVADEKMTLVKVGPKLVILFDNQSTVTADPFFDFSGKPLASLDVELGAGRAISGQQFAQLFSITEDQSVLRAAGTIPPSGADFHDASIDALPDGLRPLALLEQEGLGTRGSNVDDASSRHNIQTVSPKPTITVPSPGGPTTTVFEAGLLASRGAGESAGTHAGQSSFPTTTKAGTINFSSPDGVLKVELGGHELSGTAQTFTDAMGSLTASYAFNTATGKGTISYSYTLLDNALGIPNASFAVTVTDKDGESSPPANLVISVVDDVPVARADTDTIAGQTMVATGNVLTGVGTTSGPGNADAPGADGGVTIVGVAPGNGAGGINPGSVGIAIAGAFGTLTLNADGSYNYVHAVGGGSDVFTYTIQDADGTLSHTTLTISLADSAPGNIVIPGPGGADTQVFEAGLLASRGPGESAGSHAGQSGFPTTTQAGTITFTSIDGVKQIELGGLVLTASGTSKTFTDATGSLTASFSYDVITGKGEINYSYTLLDNTVGTPSVNFAVAVTDVDGDRTAGGNLVIAINDDAPVAVADTDLVVAGQTVAESGNVLTGVGTTSGAADVLGADGAAGGGAVVGVVLGTSGTPVSGGVGAAIAGAFGTLTLNADGSYSYVHTGMAGGGTDSFTYTIKDADGSISTATLTIAVADSSPGGISIPGAGGADTQVFEAGLGPRGGEPAGSNSAAPTTAVGTITFTSVDGVKQIEVGGLVLTASGALKTFTDATGSLTASFSYDAATGQGTISYSYTLVDNTQGDPSSVSFAVAVTDQDGDRSQGGDLVISIVDDAPVAVADTDSVAAGQLVAETGNVLTGAGTTSGAADVLGADGASAGGAVVGVVLGPSGSPVSGGVGAAITGAFGTLTLNADGSYSYVHAGAAGGGTDVFTYTIRDADGSQSTTTLNIAVADSSPGGISIPPEGVASAGTLVDEAGLGARGSEPAGSNPAAPTTTVGTIAFTSVDGVSKVELGGLVLTTSGTSQTVTDATGSLTASFTYNAATGQGTINYSYTLLDNTLGVPNTSFAVAVTDKDGDRTVAGSSLVIDIKDDGPVAHADTDIIAAGQTAAETGNVLSGFGTADGTANADIPGADGGVTVVSVAAGGGTAVAVGLTAGATIAGAFGTLTLNSDGSYSYVHTTGSGTDVFTYTIQDADGSQSTATLNIAVSDSSPGDIVIPPPGGADTQVFEAGLGARGSEPAGSHTGEAGFPTTTQTGTITFTSPDGVSTIELGGLVLTASGTPQTFTDATGSLTASYSYDAATGQGTISYSYTLLDNTIGDPSSVSFAVAVTDLDGDRSQGGDLVISVVDDAPVAVADTDSVAADQTVPETGNVITGGNTTSDATDVQGADGSLQVVSVGAGNGPALAVDPALGVTIVGAFGTLTLLADGSYSYVPTIGTPGGDHSDVFTYTIKDGDGDLSTATLTIAVANSSPGNIDVPPPDMGVTAVFEAGLPARTVGGVDEPAGSNPLASTSTDPGIITFTSLNGVSTVELGGLVLTVSDTPQTFTDATGRLTASFSYDATTGLGEIDYIYTLLDNTSGDLSTVSFGVAVTDLDGDRTVANDLVITVTDDQPTALPDTDAVVAGQTTAETGNVLTGEGTTSFDSGADSQGADGATVVAVEIGGTVVTVDPAVGATIAGAFGTLTLNADGSYSYQRTGGGGDADIFTYTIQDGDGDLSTATLVITIGDSLPTSIVIPPPGGADTQVFEAGLLASRGLGESAGSNPAAPTTTQAGVITFTSPDGVSTIELGGLVLTASGTPQTFTDATGSLTASYSYDAATGQGTISYSYTLLDNTIGDPSSVSFAVAVTDLDGDRSQGGDLVISVVDDAPVAVADTDSVAAGQTAAETGNVLDGSGTTSGAADTLGADGAASGGAVVSVALGGGTAVAVDPATGVTIVGAFGTLTLLADGSYSYVPTIGTPGGDHIDTFTYTIKDGDGDLSTATLTIAVANSSPGDIEVPPPDMGVTAVFEAGLPERTVGGVTESAGSNPLASTSTDPGIITFTSLNGVSTVELGGLVLTVSDTPQTFTDATGRLTASFSYDATTGLGEIHYIYTLLDNTQGDSSSVNFGVAVTDLDGDRTVANDLVITVTDDQPTALPDTDAVVASQTTAETGNVLTGEGTTSFDSGIDVLGADGGAVVGVEFGGNVVTVDPTTGATIAGAFGTLTLNADGSYSYQRTGGGGDADIFTYTIQDGDGDLSTATLVITIGDSLPTSIIVPPPGGPDTTVFEAGLGARGSEPAGSHAGEAGFPTTTQTGAITFVSPDGVLTIELGGLVLTASNTQQTFTDATGSLTASFSYDAATGQGTISYSYTLLDNTIGDPSSVSFAVAVTDLDGDRSQGGDLVISIVDDAPVAVADTDSVAAGQTAAETGNVLTGIGTTSGAADTLGADGAASGGAVVSVALGGGTAVAVDPATGATIVGAFGTLTLNADGSYSYVRTGGSGNDVFTYTIRDADGDLSTTTLTIAVANGVPGDISIPVEGGADTTVFEAGLGPRGTDPAGSHAGDPSFPTTTQTGTITFTSPDGVSKVELGSMVVSASDTPHIFTDATGRLMASFSYDPATGQGTISYSYTLLDNVLTNPSSVRFTVAVTDQDGDRSTGGDLVIDIVDDVPAPKADTDSLAVGQLTAETGNVISAAGTTSGAAGVDIQGADGGLAVVGIAAGNTGTPVNGGVGLAIAGAFGTLTLNANGSYTYAHTGGGGATDVFTYTIKDADGSLSTAALTIAIADSSPEMGVGSQAPVFEAGLPARIIGGIAEPAGSNPTASTTTVGTLIFTSADGIGEIKLDGQPFSGASQTFNDAHGQLTASYTYDAVTHTGTINYSYTLLDNAVDPTSTARFGFTMIDLDGDITSGGIVIAIMDDEPLAHADTDAVAMGQVTAETGNVITGVGTTSGPAGIDVQGADGAVVVGLAVGNTGADLINTATTGVPIHGAFGTLTLNADGSYSYLHDAVLPQGANIDVFTYTLVDADGDTTHATLTVTVTDSSPGSIAIPPDGLATAVFEAGLPARTIAGVPESAGSHPGDPSFQTTAAGTITFTSLDGVGSVSLGGHVLSGTAQTFADGTLGSLTASFTYNSVTHAGAINYSYTLLDNSTNGIPSKLAVAVTDNDGDTGTAELRILIFDDAPVAHADTDAVAAGQVTAETGNVITAAGTTSGAAGTDVQGADSASMVGLAAGDTGTFTIKASTVGTGVHGAFGTLTMNADGSYSYVRDFGVPGGSNTDVFTYTLMDGEVSADLSFATLTISIADSSPGNIAIPAAGSAATTVFEAGLPARGSEPAGSHAGESLFPTTAAGTITVVSPDGLGTVSLGGHVLSGVAQTFTDATGSLTASVAYNSATGVGTITYSYTLLDNTSSDPSSLSFAVVVTDKDGDSSPAANLTISIVDDAPVAHADTDAVAAGQVTESGNVITAAGTTSGAAGTDVPGADGGVVAGVAAGNTGADLVSAGTVGAAIAGAFGTLTLNADGSYSYLRTSAGGGNDVFTYTLKDGDGDLSHTTLTISAVDSTPGGIVIAAGSTTTVFEAGLGGINPPGSHSGDPAFPTAAAGTITFTSLDGVATVSLGGHVLSGTAQTFADGTIGSLTASFTYDAATHAGAINYSYQLLDSVSAVNTPNTNFAVAVTDADGDLAGGNLVITIVDDAPVANPDSDTVKAGEVQAVGNVITGVGTTFPSSGADIVGADGVTNLDAGVVGVAKGDTGVNSVGLGNPITGVFGKAGALVMNKNGSYHYEWDIGSPGIFTDVFTYTLKDNDGSLSHATITINISPNAGGGLTATSGLILMNDSGTGSDTFIVSAPEQLNASEPVSGTGEAATADILRIAGTGAYDLAASHVTNIDALVLSKNAAGSSIIVGDTMVSTADFNKDGAGGDLQISAVPMSGEVTIDASSLTGSNHIVVDSLNFGGNDIFKGGAGDDTLTGGAGSDTLTGGAGADHFKYISTSDGGTFANPLGADHIVDFNAAQGDVIDILGAAFGNIAPGANVAAIFGSSAGDTFGSPAEQFHYNTETHTLLYDSNGSDTGGVQTTLAVFDNHAIVAATNIHVI